MERILMGQIEYVAKKLLRMFKLNPVIATGVIIGAFFGITALVIEFIGQKAQEAFQKIFKSDDRNSS